MKKVQSPAEYDLSHTLLDEEFSLLVDIYNSGVRLDPPQNSRQKPIDLAPERVRSPENARRWPVMKRAYWVDNKTPKCPDPLVLEDGLPVFSKSQNSVISYFTDSYSARSRAPNKDLIRYGLFNRLMLIQIFLLVVKMEWEYWFMERYSTFKKSGENEDYKKAANSGNLARDLGINPNETLHTDNKLNTHLKKFKSTLISKSVPGTGKTLPVMFANQLRNDTAFLDRFVGEYNQSMHLPEVPLSTRRSFPDCPPVPMREAEYLRTLIDQQEFASLFLHSIWNEEVLSRNPRDVLKYNLLRQEYGKNADMLGDLLYNLKKMRIAYEKIFIAWAKVFGKPQHKISVLRSRIAELEWRIGLVKNGHSWEEVAGLSYASYAEDEQPMPFDLSKEKDNYNYLQDDQLEVYEQDCKKFGWRISWLTRPDKTRNYGFTEDQQAELEAILKELNSTGENELQAGMPQLTRYKEAYRKVKQYYQHHNVPFPDEELPASLPLADRITTLETELHYQASYLVELRAGSATLKERAGKLKYDLLTRKATLHEMKTEVLKLRETYKQLHSVWESLKIKHRIA
jgi:hypothetical protein